MHLKFVLTLFGVASIQSGEQFLGIYAGVIWFRRPLFLTAQFFPYP